MKRSAALLLLVLCPTTASAEGAWVLWYGTYPVGYGDRPTWTARDGYPSFSSCAAAQEAAINDDLVGWQTTPGGPPVGRDGNEIHFYDKKGNLRSAHVHACFPAATDPREPKGGQR